VKNIRIKKDSEIVNRLTKTKVWRDVDFAADRERYDGILRGEKRESDRQRRNQEKEAKLERERRAAEAKARAELSAQYTEPAALLAALRDGDVLLLSARWLMARAGYEEVEKKVYVKSLKKWLSRREAQPLPCRQQIEAEHAEAILPADELERLHAKLTRKDEFGQEAPDALPIVSVSHCWEGREEPDPEARTLRTVAKALAGEWSYSDPTSGLPLYAAWGFEDVGVFFDFASLYQNKPQPRTAEQDAAFKRALGGMSMWYALKP